MILAQLIVAILPVAICIWLMLRGRAGQIVWPRFFRGMLAGALFVPLIFIIFAVLKLHFDTATFFGILGESFLRMSIPEEALRLIVLIYLTRHRSYATSPYDFIIYSVAIGMGFALCENLIFIFLKGGIVVGIARAFTSIPSHYFCSVIMGAFLALAELNKQLSKHYFCCAIAIPVLLHGVYDTTTAVATLDSDYILPATIMFISLLLLEWQIARRARRAVLSTRLAD